MRRTKCCSKNSRSSWRLMEPTPLRVLWQLSSKGKKTKRRSMNWILRSFCSFRFCRFLGVIVVQIFDTSPVYLHFRETASFNNILGVFRSPLRKLLLNGDFFLGASLASILAKLALRYMDVTREKVKQNVWLNSKLWLSYFNILKLFRHFWQKLCSSWLRFSIWEDRDFQNG